MCSVIDEELSQQRLCIAFWICEICYESYLVNVFNLKNHEEQMSESRSVVTLVLQALPPKMPPQYWPQITSQIVYYSYAI